MTVFDLTKAYDDFVPDGEKYVHPQGKARVNQLSRPAEIWRPEYLETIKVCAAMGASAEQIAAAMGVRISVLEKWAREKLQVQWALAQGCIQATINVKHGLYQRAVGYSHPEKRFFVMHDKKGDESTAYVHEVDTVKQYAPDPQAALAWLRRFDPGGGWGSGDDKPTVVANVYVDNRDLPKMTDERLLEIAGGPKALLETSKKP